MKTIRHLAEWIGIVILATLGLAVLLGVATTVDSMLAEPAIHRSST